MNKTERNAKIEEYGQGFEVFTAALREIPREAWEFRPASGEWSIHEVILHMADSEAMGGLRVRKLIAEPGSILMPYDEAKWTQALNYASQNTEEALESFKLTRKSTYEVLKTLPDEIFTHSAIHPQFDQPYTFEQWLTIYTAHVPGHVGQLRNNHRIWKELNQ